jgi:RHS repeat-associated protein
MIFASYGSPHAAQTSSHPPITHSYDPISRMTDLTDQVNSNTHFVYDKRSLLTTKTDPLTRSTNLVYDNAGRLYTKTDRNNNTITYTYAPSDKLERITYPSGPPVILTYNQLNRLITMQDSLGTTTYTYDTVGRPSSSIDPHGFTVSYTYDEAGNLIELTYPGNKKVIYTYDQLNRLKTVKINWLSGTPTATYNYDSAGRLTSLTNFNGTVTTYGYDNANRLTSLENRKSDTTVLATYGFTLDGNGNRTQAVQNEPLVPTIPLGTTAYTYNAQKNRLLSAGAASFSYDNEGQLNNGYGSSYSFDYEHRLVGIGSAYQFLYDGSGNRLEAVRSGIVTRYIYDAGGNLLAEADSLNNIARYYIYGLGLMAMVTPSDQVYCYHFNAIGSTIALTSQTQAIVNKCAYDAFGNILNQVEAVTQPFKYVGQFGVMTEPNGFYYMRARYYDPDVGRFISEDPIGFEGGDVNLMAYAQNNPVNTIDPSGKIPPNLVTGGIGAAIGGTTAFINAYSSGARGWDLALQTAAGAGVGFVAGFAMNPWMATAVGTVAGGAGNYTSQWISNKYNSNPQGINWYQVGISATAGTIGGAYGGTFAMYGASPAFSTLMSAVATGISDYAGQKTYEQFFSTTATPSYGGYGGQRTYK